MNKLMEQARQPVKGKRLRPLRAALIAAALVVALLGTAGAAQFFGVQVNFQPEEPSDVPGLGKYTVTGGVAYFPADIFSQEVWELGEQENNEPHQYHAGCDEQRKRAFPHYDYG